MSLNKEKELLEDTIQTYSTCNHCKSPNMTPTETPLCHNFKMEIC